MKTNIKYTVVSLATATAMIGMSFAALSSAQTVTPLTCSVAPASVQVNQAATFTAAGGNGTYTWAGENLNVTNALGTKFAVSYPTPGVYTITTASAGLTASCDITVVAATNTGALTCAPGTQTVTLGQTATVSATGGNGSYTWSSPDLTISNVNGSGFSANYATAGLKTLTVTSNGVSDTCAINVLSAPVVTPPVDNTPGLPNTGGGYNQ